MTTHNDNFDNPNPPEQGAAEQPSDDSPADLISRLEQERDAMKALAQRARADYENQRRRFEDERWTLARNASNSVVARLLPCVDDLERAADALPADAPAGWGEGVRLVLQNIRSMIKDEGVARIDPSPGDPFDPHEHEAVHRQPSAEQPAGSVLSAFRPGYRSPDRVLRPAQVIVSSGPEAGNAESNPSANDDDATAPPNNHTTATTTRPDSPDEKELISNG